MEIKILIKLERGCIARLETSLQRSMELFIVRLFCCIFVVMLTVAMHQPVSRSRSPPQLTPSIEIRLDTLEEENTKLKKELDELKEKVVSFLSGRDLGKVEKRAKMLEELFGQERGALIRERNQLLAGLRSISVGGKRGTFQSPSGFHFFNSGDAPEWMKEFRDAFVLEHGLDVSNPQRVSIAHDRIVSVYDEKREDFLSAMETQWGEEYADKLNERLSNPSWNREILEYSK